jgi:hypothetical protein
MNYTDEQLKKTLAKMLPEICYMTRPDNKCLAYSETGLLVLDTELLHLCWMVEDDFNSKQQDNYGKELYKLIPYGKMLFSATWQQRVTALAKVKGIEMA